MAAASAHPPECTTSADAEGTTVARERLYCAGGPPFGTLNHVADSVWL
jgi:hypothetical protein